MAILERFSLDQEEADMKEKRKKERGDGGEALYICLGRARLCLASRCALI
jgi:hypothetical protein